MRALNGCRHGDPRQRRPGRERQDGRASGRARTGQRGHEVGRVAGARGDQPSPQLGRVAGGGKRSQPECRVAGPSERGRTTDSRPGCPGVVTNPRCRDAIRRGEQHGADQHPPGGEHACGGLHLSCHWWATLPPRRTVRAIRAWLPAGPRLEELDRIAGRILDEDLLAPDAGDDLVAESGALLAQPGHRSPRCPRPRAGSGSSPPGCGQCPVGHRRPPPGPPPGALSTRRRSPCESIAKVGAGCMSSWNPSFGSRSRLRRRRRRRCSGR